MSTSIAKNTVVLTPMDTPKDSETTFGIAAMGEVPNNEDFDITTATAIMLIAIKNLKSFIIIILYIFKSKINS
ncbi:hypothetical protein SUT503_09840 [Streptococcus parasuis]|nr:hypothetical protein SUT503_09840 [Streptococcus parasuis]